ncbi:MAG TPA: hypothetical protein VI504_11595 [Candidatus Eisenbacteria bacterium]|jgi:hypothetical protein
MRAHRWLVPALCATLLLVPLAPARAVADENTPESRVGVLLMVVCGLSLKAAIPAPVPWSGVAVVSCLFGFLDAAFSADSPNP